jgi:VIT1/CCC1 family predicted Fe2+/Mn2+ transporter
VKRGVGTAAHFRANLRIERDHAMLYATLAELARDAELARIYRRMAAAERAHARFWEQRLIQTGEALPAERISLRIRTLLWLARRFGTDFVVPSVVRLPHADEADAAPVGGVPVGIPTGVTSLPRAGRHGGGRGNNLRAAVLGINDGLVSNVSLVMGMAGAASSDHSILLAGMAGLVAGACSMALGEWLSVNSSREFYQAQIRARAERLAIVPDRGAAHLAELYQAKGLDSGSADKLAAHLVENPQAALDTVVREDLGIDPGELGGSAYGAAVSSFCMFAAGAFFPVAPYLFLHGREAMLAGVLATAVALSVVGMATSLFTGRSMLFSVARQLGITLVAATITYTLGHLLGVQLSG